MPYQIIARQWRPKGFEELLGQDLLKNTLMNALRLKRLPHALLFSGQRGTGKTSMARILAKAIRCLKTSSLEAEEIKIKAGEIQNIEPCQKCEECIETHKGINTNVIEIDGASNTGVDSIRELTNHISYVPSVGRYKIYIIDEVHMLSTSAFNALLKTLEEPPSHVYFILATTEVHKIPLTILSRCQRFEFQRIPTQIIFNQLKKILEKEKILAEPQALWEIARQGEGSLRDAQSLLDQMISYFPTEAQEKENVLTLKKTAQVLGLTDRNLLLECINCIFNRDAKGILKLIEKIYFTGSDPGEFIKSLLKEFRNLLMIKIFLPHQSLKKSTESTNSIPTASPIEAKNSTNSFHFLKDSKELSFSLEDSFFFDGSKEEISNLQKLSQNTTEEEIHFLFDLLLKGSQDVLSSKDSKTTFEMLLFRMTQALRLENLHSWMGGSLPSKSKETSILFYHEKQKKEPTPNQ